MTNNKLHASLRLTTLILVVSCQLLVVSCFAFKDMPEDHWAAADVDKLVQMGVIHGYPDGTFRGKSKVNRYQIASFLDKLAKELKTHPGIKKLIAELRTEFNVEKYKIKYPSYLVYSGTFQSNFLFSQGVTRNLMADYRTRLNLERKFNKTNNLTITLDTMDAGYNNPMNRNLTEEMIDMKGNFKFSEAKWSLGFGGGDIMHSDSLIPSSTGTIFRRRKPSIKAKIAKNHTTLKAGYTILNLRSNGSVATHDMSLGLGYSFRPLPFLGKTKASTILHLAKGSGRDIRGEIKIISHPTRASRIQLDIGMATGQISGLYVGCKVKSKRFKFSVYRAGSKHRTARLNKYDYLPLNIFKKYILDGTTDIGIAYTHPFHKNIKGKLMTDLVLSGNYNYGANYPGTSLTSEIDLIVNLNKRTKGILFYRNYEVPSGINYADSAIAETVPTRSDVIGFGLEAEL